MVDKKNEKKKIHIDISISDAVTFASGMAVGAAVVALIKSEHPENIVTPIVKGAVTIAGYRMLYGFLTGR